MAEIDRRPVEKGLLVEIFLEELDMTVIDSITSKYENWMFVLIFHIKVLKISVVCNTAVGLVSNEKKSVTS